MAKAPKAEAATPKFQYDLDLPVPTIRRSNGELSETAQMLAGMPLGASYLTPVIVPDTITDATEAEKAFKDGARIVSNRLSGAARRFVKQNPGHKFDVRTVTGGEQGRGVRVYCVGKPPVGGETA